MAMSSLHLPPYVLEHIFDALKWHAKHANYQQRKAIDFVWIPPSNNAVNLNFVHLIIEERTHWQNIQLFIQFQNMLRRRK